MCVLRYMHHYFMATGVHGMAVRDEFKEHADAEREHADAIADRIQQLGGKPDYNPASLIQRSASQYAEGNTLADMIREDLIAERIVIEVYQQMIRHFGDHDPTTRVMIEGILRTRKSTPAICPTCCSSSIPRPARPKARIPAPIRWTCTRRARRGSSAAAQAKERRCGASPSGQRLARAQIVQPREQSITANSTCRRRRVRAAAMKEPQQPKLSGESESRRRGQPDQRR